MHSLCSRCRPAGAHRLDASSVAAAVRRTAPGSFVLGYRDGSSFLPFYVGRSDSDVGAALQHWVDAPSCPSRRPAPSVQPWELSSRPRARFGGPAALPVTLGFDTGYTHFVFCYADSALAAFESECRDFHELDGLDNDRHPVPPADSPWACPLHA
jgi:hypothetical protein